MEGSGWGWAHPFVPGDCHWELSLGVVPGVTPVCPRGVSGSRRSGARSLCPGSGAGTGGGSVCPAGAEGEIITAV